MKKIIITILVFVLLIGAYVLVITQKNKKELSNLSESQFVDQSKAVNTVPVAPIASSVELNRVNGSWTVDSKGEYTVDAASLKFEFTGYKPGGQHVGTFNTMNTKISLDKDGNPVSASITIDPKSVKTDSEAVDKHLQATEFFDTATYPEISIAIKEIKTEGKSVTAITDLTMKGVTKTLAIPVTLAKTTVGTEFTIDTKIKISDYVIAYGPVLDDVRVALVGVIKKQ